MQRVELPNRPTVMPEGQALFEFNHEGIFARVKLRLKAAMIDGHIEIAAQAFQMTEAGEFVSAPNGDPSRTPETSHTINTSGLATSVGLAPTHTLKPGWVRDVGVTGNIIDLDHLPDGATVAEALPPEGQPGDRVYVEPYLYVYDEGIAYRTAVDKVKELCAILAVSAPLSGRGFSLT